MKVFSSYVLTVAFSSVLFFFPLYLTYDLDFSHKLDLEILSVSVIDFIFTSIILLGVIFFLFSSYKAEVIRKFDVEYRILFNKYSWVLYFLTIMLMFHVYQRYDLIISGVSREDLIRENYASRFIWIMSPVSVILFPVFCVFKYRKRLIVCSFIVLVLVCIYELSRSQFLSACYILVILVLLKGGRVKEYRLIIILGLTMLFMVSIMTVYQGRASSFSSALNSIVHTLFKYRSFSFYLSEEVVERYAYDYENFLFPIFGFFSERILSIIEPLSNPIVTQNSTFLYDYVRLGPNNQYDANVLYPMWSWFYAIYGPLGLILKFLYFVFLFLLIRGRLPFTFLYLMFVVVSYGYVRHPLSDNATVYAVLSVLVLDGFLIIMSRYKFISPKGKRG